MSPLSGRVCKTEKKMPKTRAKNKSPASKSGTSPAKKSKIMMKESDLDTPCFIVDMEKEWII